MKRKSKKTATYEDHARTASPIVAQFKKARLAAVPLVAITTPDPGATVQAICDSLNGDGIRFLWDIVEGLRPRSEAAKEFMPKLFAEQDPTVGNPLELLRLIRKIPERGLVFMSLANRWIVDPMIIQATWNLRDEFKSDGRMLVMLAPAIDLSAELVGDVVVFDEPLPGPTELCGIINDQCKVVDVTADDATLTKAIEAVQGLPAFQAEQVTAMSLTHDGLDVANLWERKRRQIELTPGLKVNREDVGFADIGGVDLIKDFLRQILAGKSRPNAVVFIDEIEKFLAGATGHGGDTSGVSQDQLGSLLAYMQDNTAAGCIFVGPPGSAKSMVAKATGTEAGIPTIQLDLGAMKGSLVGASEQNLRAALKVISAVSNGKSLWIATCNSIGELPPELRRRFTLGTFFFDLPDHIERGKIWAIWFNKFALPGRMEIPDDDGWTGAEIRQCCDISWRLGCSLKDAARFVVPVSRSAAEQLERLRKAAEGRFLSASTPGVYRRGDANNNGATAPKRAGRQLVAMED